MYNWELIYTLKNRATGEDMQCRLRVADGDAMIMKIHELESNQEAKFILANSLD